MNETVMLALDVKRVPRDELPALIGELARLQAEAIARLYRPEPMAGITEAESAKLLTAGDVADRLGVNRQRAYELMRNGTLPVIRLGRQVRMAAAALDEWIREGGIRHRLPSP